jgi:hypothetical protein
VLSVLLLWGQPTFHVCDHIVPCIIDAASFEPTQQIWFDSAEVKKQKPDHLAGKSRTHITLCVSKAPSEFKSGALPLEYPVHWVMLRN